MIFRQKLTGEARHAREETCHNATLLTTTNPTEFGLGFNLDHRGERPANDNLNNDKTTSNK